MQDLEKILINIHICIKSLEEGLTGRQVHASKLSYYKGSMAQFSQALVD